MKKTNFLVLVASIVTLGFFSTSCSKDQSNPVITLTENSIKDSASVSVGDSLTIEFTATADNALKTVEITNSSAAVVKSFDASLAKFTVKIAAPATAGTEKYNITVTDKKDLTTTRTLSITVKAAAPALVTYTGKALGAQSATPGSYFDVATGTVVSQANATAATTVSYSYAAVGTTTAVSTLLAPAVRIANGLTKTSAGLEHCYFAKNTTLTFSTVTAAQIAALTVSATSPESITVAQGDVIEFLTATGKKGLISVTSVTAGTAGVITIDVKVQQ